MSQAAFLLALLLFFKFLHAFSAAEKILLPGNYCSKGIALGDIDLADRILNHLVYVARGIARRVFKGGGFIVAQNIFE